MKKVIFALAICATIVSCQKKEDKDPIDVSKTTYLMSQHWQLKYYTLRPDVDDSSSFAAPVTIPTCSQDDYLGFNTINRVSLYDGLSKCVIGSPDSIVYGYALTSNDAHLQIYTNPEDQNHQIYLEGAVTYPSIDSFIVTYRAPKQGDSTKTSEHIKYYVKIQ